MCAEVALNLRQLYKDGIGTDVTLTNGGTRYRVHKIVLIASSPYFQSLFFGKGFAPITDTIDMSQFDAKAFKYYIDYLYGLNIFSEFSENELRDNWRLYMKITEILKYTNVSWSKLRTLENLVVPLTDFIDFVAHVDNIYDGEMPEDIVTNVFPRVLTDYVDLSSFSPDFIMAIMTSPLWTVRLTVKAQILSNVLNKHPELEEQVLTRGPFMNYEKYNKTYGFHHPTPLIVKITALGIGDRNNFNSEPIAFGRASMTSPSFSDITTIEYYDAETKQMTTKTLGHNDVIVRIRPSDKPIMPGNILMAYVANTRIHGISNIFIVVLQDYFIV